MTSATNAATRILDLFIHLTGKEGGAMMVGHNSPPVVLL